MLARSTPLSNGTFGAEVVVLNPPAGASDTPHTLSNGTFGAEVVVISAPAGASDTPHPVHNGTFGAEVRIEYFAWGNWSDWWVMYNYSTPVISNENPANNSLEQAISLIWNCTIENPDGNQVNWSIECSNGQTNSSNNDNNGSKHVSLTGLSYTTKYTIWVNATNSVSDESNTTSIFYFTTLNPPPVISNENPANNTNILPSFTPLSIYISDAQGELMDWSIQLSDGTTSSNVNANNGTKNHAVVLNYGNSYKWWVNVTDGTKWTRKWYVFNTYDNNKPEISNPTPSNNSLGNNITDTNVFRIYISDPEGDPITWTIQVCNGDSSSGSLQNNGTKSCSLSVPLSYNSQYKIWVNASDPTGSGFTNRTWFVFNTEVVGGNAPTIVINTTTGIEETNATGNAYISESVFPAEGWFQYGTAISSLSSTLHKAVTLGEFDENITGLTPGTFYYLRAKSSNVYGTNTTGYNNFMTKPYEPYGFTVTDFNHSVVSLSWNKGTGADNTILERHNTPNWARGVGTELYNGTGTSYDDATVNPSSTYYYQIWSYATDNSMHQYSDDNDSLNITTLPQPPQNVDYTLIILGNGTCNLTINWNKGTGADNTHIMKNTGEAPDEAIEGTEVYNNTGTTVTDAFISVPYLYTLWSWNSTTGLYSEPAYLGWYASWINVYNESKPSQAIPNWDIEISNPAGDEVYASNSNNNPLIINISDMPTGSNIGFSFSAPDYKNRVYKKDVSETGAIFFNAYLPPNYVPTGDTGTGDGGDPSTGELRYHTETGNISNYNTDETINLNHEIYEIDTVEKYERIGYDRFLHADSASVSNPAINLVLTLNFTCDEIYNIIAYENLNAEDIYTDSASVSNPTVDKNISFNHKPVERIIGVYAVSYTHLTLPTN